MYNVTLRRVCVTTVEKQYVLHTITYNECVFCSLSYPACKALAPYRHLWPAPVYNIFPQYLINVTIFGGGGGGEFF